MEQLIERIASAPAGMKVAVVAALAFAATALNYFAVGVPLLGQPISTLERRIQAVDRDQKKLDLELIEKQAIANNLNQFRREKELLDQQLKEAISELPEDKNIDELLRSFQEQGTKAGLEILTIEPQPVVPEGFYARIPIPMSVQGSYNEVATFLDAIGRLRRIVNVNNISLDQAKKQNGRLVLTAKFLATTFMFVDPKDVKTKPAKPAAPGARR